LIGPAAALLAGALAGGFARDAAAPPASSAEDTCLPRAPGAGPGSADPFRPPSPAATEANSDGKTLYRQGNWDAARARYREAQSADPEFLAPALNVACSFVRQERFDEATAEVLKLIERAYVPWAREILGAADLGALKTQPQMARVQQAMAEGARRWGAGLADDLLFVARQREPLKLPATPDGGQPVVLVLGLHQEVFAWSPASARYRQVTAEDGHVLAMAQSIDRRQLLYVTAEKLVRRPGAAAALRGTVLHTLNLAAMSSGPAVAIEGDVHRLALAPAGAGFSLAIDGDRRSGSFTLSGGQRLLLPARPLDPRRPAGGMVVLTAAGVTPARERSAPAAGRPSCRWVAREKKGPQGLPAIEVAAPGRGPIRLATRFGAGLAGLAIP
jgi:hypothetical protein